MKYIKITLKVEFHKEKSYSGPHKIFSDGGRGDQNIIRIHIPVEDWFVSDELVDGAGLEYVQGGHQLNAAVSAASLANR